jgi:hypothetical protein
VGLSTMLSEFRVAYGYIAAGCCIAMLAAYPDVCPISSASSSRASPPRGQRLTLFRPQGLK